MTVVMTMTSVSVIMAVMVINCYERGHLRSSPPDAVKRFILNRLAKLLCMPSDVSTVAESIQMVGVKCK